MLEFLAPLSTPFHFHESFASAESSFYDSFNKGLGG